MAWLGYQLVCHAAHPSRAPPPPRSGAPQLGSPLGRAAQARVHARRAPDITGAPPLLCRLQRLSKRPAVARAAAEFDFRRGEPNRLNRLGILGAGGAAAGRRPRPAATGIAEATAAAPLSTACSTSERLRTVEQPSASGEHDGAPLRTPPAPARSLPPAPAVDSSSADGCRDDDLRKAAALRRAGARRDVQPRSTGVFHRR